MYFEFISFGLKGQLFLLLFKSSSSIEMCYIVYWKLILLCFVFHINIWFAYYFNQYLLSLFVSTHYSGQDTNFCIYMFYFQYMNNNNKNKQTKNNDLLMPQWKLFNLLIQHRRNLVTSAFQGYLWSYTANQFPPIDVQNKRE